ncbi:MAG TPA: helix-turn-helix transcriptional regulator [Ktedonobacteraceae bacterium]|nr:helix-turn-helix transcriptional regulator [Ktedonobacteraceae bacterium]
MIRLRLKEVLEEKHVAQAKLSRMTDVSINTIQSIYHNPYHDVALSTLERLAKGLKVDVTELFEVVPDEQV